MHLISSLISQLMDPPLQKVLGGTLLPCLRAGLPSQHSQTSPRRRSTAELWGLPSHTAHVARENNRQLPKPSFSLDRCAGTSVSHLIFQSTYYCERVLSNLHKRNIWSSGRLCWANVFMKINLQLLRCRSDYCYTPPNSAAQPFFLGCYPRMHLQTVSCPCCYPSTCSSQASSSSCARASTPESSPPARKWGRSAGGPSAGTQDTAPCALGTAQTLSCSKYTQKLLLCQKASAKCSGSCNDKKRPLLGAGAQIAPTHIGDEARLHSLLADVTPDHTGQVC